MCKMRTSFFLIRMVSLFSAQPECVNVIDGICKPSAVARFHNIKYWINVLIIWLIRLMIAFSTLAMLSLRLGICSILDRRARSIGSSSGRSGAVLCLVIYSKKYITTLRAILEKRESHLLIRRFFVRWILAADITLNIISKC